MNIDNTINVAKNLNDEDRLCNLVFYYKTNFPFINDERIYKAMALADPLMRYFNDGEISGLLQLSPEYALERLVDYLDILNRIVAPEGVSFNDDYISSFDLDPYTKERFLINIPIIIDFLINRDNNRSLYYLFISLIVVEPNQLSHEELCNRLEILYANLK